MHITRAGLIALLVVAFILSIAPLAAADKDKGLTIEIEGEDEASISISLSGGWAESLAEGLLDANLECDADIEPDTEAMLRHLKRKGRGSKYTLRDDDKTIHARRMKSSWEMDIRNDDGTKAKVVLPWALAECMLGDREAMERYRGEGEMAFVVEDDGVLKVKVE